MWQEYLLLWTRKALSANSKVTIIHKHIDIFLYYLQAKIWVHLLKKLTPHHPFHQGRLIIQKDTYDWTSPGPHKAHHNQDGKMQKSITKKESYRIGTPLNRHHHYQSREPRENRAVVVDAPAAPGDIVSRLSCRWKRQRCKQTARSLICGPFSRFMHSRCVK